MVLCIFWWSATLVEALSLRTVLVSEALGSLAMGLTQRTCREVTGGIKRHQAEEPAESHWSLPLWMKGHLLVYVWDPGLESGSHLQPPKHDHFGVSFYVCAQSMRVTQVSKPHCLTLILCTDSVFTVASVSPWVDMGTIDNAETCSSSRMPP